ncbi:MAG: hypothetical protein KAG18_08135 [Sinobacterium sp.]|nr:hypothetical protein [Sinobacterium sp.]
MIKPPYFKSYTALRNKPIRLVLLFLLISYEAAAAAEEYAIFTNNLEVPAISPSKAKMIFIGKAKSIKKLGRVTLINWPLSSSERSDFYQKLLHKTPAQVNSKWASLAFSGKAKPPVELSTLNTELLKQWLENNPKGIAYAPISQVPEGVNILLTVQ